MHLFLYLFIISPINLKVIIYFLFCLSFRIAWWQFRKLNGVALNVNLLRKGDATRVLLSGAFCPRDCVVLHLHQNDIPHGVLNRVCVGQMARTRSREECFGGTLHNTERCVSPPHCWCGSQYIEANPRCCDLLSNYTRRHFAVLLQYYQFSYKDMWYA